MSKRGILTPTLDGEEYELPSVLPTDPLLPQYDPSKNPHPQVHFAPLPAGSSRVAQHAETLRQRRRSRAARVLLCTWATVVPLFLGLALLGCWVGRDTLKELRHWDAWESVPQDVKDWLQSMVPATQDLGTFPTNIGYAGPTPTGKEPALLATAPHLPLVTPLAPLVPPKSKSSFHVPNYWGNLSPYHSVESHGVDESPLIPKGCQLDELHWLQRHGARYPTSSPGGPADFAKRIKGEKWTAKGDLAFMNDWEYSLGAEVLTPFGRSQLYNLGVAARVKYGYLLDKMDRLPVFRTESQDRMLKSAQNFAAGFFGIPVENQYNLEVMIEAPGFNNTLAPYISCANENATYPDIWRHLAEYDAKHFVQAARRIDKLMEGYEVTPKDARQMMDMCAYETVALGYSAFCPLFHKSDWRAYEHRSDLYWWHSGSFGYPLAKAQGVGWVQELVSRLTHTRITEHNSTTNSSFHNDIQFPVHDPLYVDFTHDTQFALLLPTMNLTSFAAEPPSWDGPNHHSFTASEIMPFATNMQVQVLSCVGPASAADRKRETERVVRIVLNDAVVPLDGIEGCGEASCILDVFVGGMQRLIGEVDFAASCGRRAE